MNDVYHVCLTKVSNVCVYKCVCVCVCVCALEYLQLSVCTCIQISLFSCLMNNNRGRVTLKVHVNRWQ